ncbi:hypothetical protein BF49_1325 [Bradyrhizobium sp.]|nr:hypothetical protein BF49_1325 [Bradyrhizobium sp.]
MRKIARCALIETVSIHLPAGIDNTLAEIGMIVVCHEAGSEKAIQDW